MSENNTILKEAVDELYRFFGDSLDEITIERAVFGLFYSGVKLSSSYGGLCFTPVKQMPEAVCCPSSARAMPLSGKLSGRSVKSTLDDVFSDNILRRTLAIATLNALSSMVWDEKPHPELELLSNTDAFDLLNPDNYGKTVVVGALVPMIRKLLSAGADFNILEEDPRTLKERELKYYLPADEANLCVPDADLLVITGVTILNNTLQGLLDLAKPGAEILITGPTAGLLPDVLIKRGVTMIGGITVTKADEVLDIICEGGSGYHFFGKYAERTVIRKII